MDESQFLVQHAARTRFSRRRLLQSGAVVAGTLAGAGAFDVASAFGANGADPKPIPGGFDENFNMVPKDPFIHVLPPGVGFEMSMITDLNGVVAAADVQGTANNGTYFFDCDMRFMDGVYVGTDGKLRQGSFGFVWIDLFTPGVNGPEQITDYNPGIKPSGLFWTMAFDASAFEANQGQGTARYRAQNLPMPNYGTFENSISPNPTWVPGHVSFEVTWAGGGDRTKVRDDLFDFGGTFVTGPATITFTASDNAPGSTVYTSDAAGQSNPLPPGVGHERNGVFFQ